MRLRFNTIPKYLYLLSYDQSIHNEEIVSKLRWTQIRVPSIILQQITSVLSPWALLRSAADSATSLDVHFGPCNCYLSSLCIHSPHPGHESQTTPVEIFAHKREKQRPNRRSNPLAIGISSAPRFRQCWLLPFQIPLSLLLIPMTHGNYKHPPASQKSAMWRQPPLPIIHNIRLKSASLLTLRPHFHIPLHRSNLLHPPPLLIIPSSRHGFSSVSLFPESLPPLLPAISWSKSQAQSSPFSQLSFFMIASPQSSWSLATWPAAKSPLPYSNICHFPTTLCPLQQLLYYFITWGSTLTWPCG